MGCQAGTTTLFEFVVLSFPPLDKRYGCYNPASRTDSGGLSLHAEGRAFDAYVPPEERGPDGKGQTAFMWLYEHRYDCGLQEIIYNSQIWTLARDREGIRSYGVNPHLDHIHCGQTWAGARAETPWYHRAVTKEEAMASGWIGADAGEVPLWSSTPGREVFAAVSADGKHLGCFNGRWLTGQPYPYLGVHIIDLPVPAWGRPIDVKVRRTPQGTASVAVLCNDGGTLHYDFGPA